MRCLQCNAPTNSSHCSDECRQKYVEAEIVRAKDGRAIHSDMALSKIVLAMFANSRIFFTEKILSDIRKKPPRLASEAAPKCHPSRRAGCLSNTAAVNQVQARFIDPGHVDDAIVAAEDLYAMYEAKLARLRVFIVQLKAVQAANDDVARALWRAAS